MADGLAQRRGPEIPTLLTISNSVCFPLSSRSKLESYANQVISRLVTAPYTLQRKKKEAVTVLPEELERMPN